MFSTIRFLLLAFCCAGAAMTLRAAVPDTVRIFQYNLLNYGAADNPVAFKNPRLSTIINYAQPDIFGANEISQGPGNSLDILNNVLGTGWEKGAYSNAANQLQTNMLFWKSARFGLARQTVVTNAVRDIIAYKLYYKDPSLAQTHDTTFLTVIVGHLKAGDSPSDSATRAVETQAVVSYLNGLNGPGNYIFMGDCNVYSSNERSYLNLTTGNANANGRLYDPLNQPGDWHSNSAFAMLHTQATRSVSLSDGGSGGGLDDRFDNILVSGPVMSNTRRIGYVAGSYKAVGQDGRHLNRAVNANPTNTSAPAAVIQALYEMSDHLPVMAELTVTLVTPSGMSAVSDPDAAVTVGNPLHGPVTIGFAGTLSGARLSVQLYSLQGQRLYTGDLTVREPSCQLPFMLPAPGGYLLRIEDRERHTVITKQLICE